MNKNRHSPFQSVMDFYSHAMLIFFPFMLICLQNAVPNIISPFLKEKTICYLPSSTSKTGIPSFVLDSEESLRNPYSKAYSTAYSSFFSPIKFSKHLVSVCLFYHIHGYLKEVGNNFSTFLTARLYTLKDVYHHCLTSDATIMVS